MIQAEGVSIDHTWEPNLTGLENLAGAAFAIFMIGGVLALAVWALIAAFSHGAMSRRVNTVLGIAVCVAIGGATVSGVGWAARAVPSMDVAVPAVKPYEEPDRSVKKPSEELATGYSDPSFKGSGGSTTADEAAADTSESEDWGAGDDSGNAAPTPAPPSYTGYSDEEFKGSGSSAQTDSTGTEDGDSSSADTTTNGRF